MSRLHMNFKNIHKSTRKAATDLFDAKPWSGTDEEKQSKFERFLRDASAVYSIPQPTLSVVSSEDGVRTPCGLVAPNTIVMDKYSVTSLFNAFRQHMQYSGAVDVAFLDRRDAQSWACSLFYIVRPILFRKQVRLGKIYGVYADDLLTSASLLSRQDEVDEAFAGIVAGSYDEEGDEALEPEQDVSMPADDDPNAPERLTIAQAAERMGVSQSTVRNMINDGRLNSVREGRRVFVTA